MAEIREDIQDDRPTRFTEGGKVPKPHPKSQLEWPEGKPRGGKPPTRENGEIAYRRPKA